MKQSKEINLDKAPEGATHRVGDVYYRLFTTGWHRWTNEEHGWIECDAPDSAEVERVLQYDPDEVAFNHIGEANKKVEPVRALDTQEGGNHYKSLKIQPVEYIHANNIGYIEGCVIKYVTRWRSKNGIEDLRKAQHFIDLLIELENEQ